MKETKSTIFKIIETKLSKKKFIKTKMNHRPKYRHKRES